MNPIRRYTLHPLRSRHNPITRLALFTCLLAIALAAIDAAYAYLSLAQISSADKVMVAELTLVLEGKANLIEPHGAYATVISVMKTL